MKVLVVDDNKLIGQSVCRALEGDCEVRYARNGKEALSLLKEQDCDIIISDIDMPVMNGLELFREVGAPNKFIFMSGDTSRAHGACLSKPFTRQELCNVVNTVAVRLGFDPMFQADA